MDIKTAITHCIDDLGLAPTTLRTYKQGLYRFVEYLDEQGIKTDSPASELKVDSFIHFLPWLNRSKSKQTANVYGSASKAFLDFLILEGQLEFSLLDSARYNQATKRSHKRREDKLPRWPGRNDVDLMLKTVRIYNEESPRKERNIAMLEFLASSGCRVSEMTNLNVRDIDLVNRTTVVTGKGSKDRRVFFNQAAADAIQNYWIARKSSMATNPAFSRHDKGAGNSQIKRLTTTSVRNVVNDIAMIAGIDPSKFSPHYFRHAFAIKVLNETDNLALVQDLLGHKDPNSTRVYAKIYPEDMQRMHERIFNN